MNLTWRGAVVAVGAFLVAWAAALALLVGVMWWDAAAQCRRGAHPWADEDRHCIRCGRDVDA